MIYTVTLNPAIDYVVHMDRLAQGEINRSTSENIYFGGKGINVSMVLKELGIPSVALGFVAGFTGLAIEKEVRKAGIETDFVLLKEGYSRINVKIRAAGETDINGQGPYVSAEESEAFYQKLEQLKDGDMIVLAGSIPATLPNDIYEKILDCISDKKVHAVMDATGELLHKVLKFKPFMVKPNHHELGELFSVKVETREDAVKYAKKLQEMGARNVLVSMAELGAVLVCETGEVYTCDACEGEVCNSVGAGDSMVAGFLAGLCGVDFNGENEGIMDETDVESCNYAHALKLGTAAGGATAFSDGLAGKEEIKQLFRSF